MPDAKNEIEIIFRNRDSTVRIRWQQREMRGGGRSQTCPEGSAVSG